MRLSSLVLTATVSTMSVVGTVAVWGLPTIERDYRTTSYRMLVGHSRGGLLVCYSLVFRPHLFDARVAHSPALWRDEEVFPARLGEFLESAPALDSFFWLFVVLNAGISGC